MGWSFESVWKPSPHHADQAMRVVQTVVGVLVAMHPIHALLHPGDAVALGASLAAKGVPAGVALAWVAYAVLFASSGALIAGRGVTVAAPVMAAVLLVAALLLHAPYWYVVGGGAEDGHPGVEFHVLLLVCLAGVWLRARGVARAFDVVRVGAAVMLMAHPLHGFVLWDVAGMREWGHGMEKLGFPFGVPLVWTVISGQLLGAIAIVFRRAVVPACAFELAVLLNGLWVSHWPNWFVVGPGENGMEYPLLYVTCFAVVLAVHWPLRRSSASVVAVAG